MVNYDRNDPVHWVGFMYLNSECHLRRTGVDLDTFNSMVKGATLLTENGLTYLEILAGGAVDPTPRIYWDPLRSDLTLHLTGLPENTIVLGMTVRDVSSVRASIDECRPPVYLTNEGDLFMFGSLWLTSARIYKDNVFPTLYLERDEAGMKRYDPLDMLFHAGYEEATGLPGEEYAKVALADANLRGLSDTLGYKLLEIMLNRITQTTGGE